MPPHKKSIILIYIVNLLKPIVLLLMALLVSLTSLGVAVSTHTCSEAGISETRIGHLKACCMHPMGQGIRSEPCCKVMVNHVKLATVSGSSTGHLFAGRASSSIAFIVLPNRWLPESPALATFRQTRPPEKPPLFAGLDTQAHLCRFLI